MSGVVEANEGFERYKFFQRADFARWLIAKGRITEQCSYTVEPRRPGFDRCTGCGTPLVKGDDPLYCTLCRFVVLVE